MPQFWETHPLLWVVSQPSERPVLWLKTAAESFLRGKAHFGAQLQPDLSNTA